MAINPIRKSDAIVSKDLTENSSRGKLIPLLIFAAAGTGGMLTSSSIQQSLNWIHYPRVKIEHSATKVSPSSPVEQLTFIRQVFALNISELAIVFGVTRPTVYSWLQGNNLKTEALIKVAGLSKMAKELESLNVNRMGSLIHRPIFDGHSLFDKMKHNEDITEFLKILKSISTKETAGKLVSKGSERNKKLVNPSDYSTPFYRK